MAVSGLEQRFVPLLDWQFVWQPWGPAGRYPVDDGDDDVAKSQRIQLRNCRRSHSWAGYTTDAQRERFQPDSEQPSQGREPDPSANKSSGVGACELKVAESAGVSCRHSGSSSFGECGGGPANHDGHSLSPCRPIDMEDAILKDDDQIFEAWNGVRPHHQGSGQPTRGATTDLSAADPAVYASSGQDSDSQVGLYAPKSRCSSDLLSTGVPSENSCENSCGNSCDGQDSYHSMGDEPSSAIDSSHAEPGRRASHRRTCSRPKVAPAEITTLMLQNLPYALSRDDLLAALNRCGYAGLFNFCHVPHTFTTGRNQGVAFVNFLLPEVARAFANEWHGSRTLFGVALVGKALRVKAANVQGTEACERLAQSRRMRRVKTGTFKPLIIGGQVPCGQ